ncbi:MAG: carboxypeptidase regulatory-like domain-containing protein, partial [Nannocystaceae bacterium]
MVAALGLSILAWLWFSSSDETPVQEPLESSAKNISSRALLSGSPEATQTALGRRQLLFQAHKATVFGRVHDPDGQALAGATVCASLISRLVVLKPLNAVHCVTSEADGSYRIEGLLPVDIQVSASAPQHIPNHYRKATSGPLDQIVRLQAGGEHGGIDIELRPGGVKVDGVVLDISGGEIEGAQVYSGDAYTRSDAEGAFALWVEPGNVQVAANAQGYAENDASGIAPGHAFELLLTPESILIGKVVAAETGAPLADVDVFSSDFSQRWGGVGPDAVTREDGTFRIDGLDPGSYKPVALNEKTYGAAGATVHLGLGQTSDEVVIEAHPAFAVQGTILTGEQQTCVSGRVSLRDSVNKRTVASRVERDGEVRIHGVLPGTYDVEVSCEGFVSLEHYDAIEVSEPITRQVWEVEAGYAIRGIVVDATGEPVAGTRVMASQTLKEGAPRAKRSRGWGQQTREDGRFELEGMRSGSYEIKLLGGNRASPAEPTKFEIEDGDVEDLKIELSGEGIVRGRVIDERGEAVANVTIDLDAVERGGWMSGHSTRSADDGTFALEHVQAGSYRATAKQGWSTTLRTPGTSDDDIQGVAIDVAVGDVTEIELKVEARGASIRGTVVDADGGPVVDAFLSATRESDSATKVAGSSMRTSRWGNWWKKPVLTDADGSFELVDLTEGVYTVRAYRKGGGEGFSEGVETDSSCTVAIRATGTLMGRVTLAGGPAPEEFTVTLRDRKAGLSRHESFFRTGGVFRFEELPAGTFELSAAAG